VAASALIAVGALVATLSRRDRAGAPVPGAGAPTPETSVPRARPWPPVERAEISVPAMRPDDSARTPAPAAAWPAAWRAQLDRILRSGAMAPEPAARGRAIFAAWGRQSSEGVEALEDGGCHSAGCFVTLTFTDARAADRFHDQVTTAGDPSSSWRGPRQRLEPLSQPNGKMKVTWILLPEPVPPDRPPTGAR